MRVVVALVALGMALPVASHAAVTISACRSDSLTAAGKVTLSAAAARKVRGATAERRFQALPLFGLPRTAGWSKGATGQQSFSALPAGNWVGVMSWRFKKGGRTVLSGSERSQAVRVGRARGSASCTLAVGAKPPDKTPPALFINPDDSAWHRGQVQLSARDDFSGVKSMSYSIDGGPRVATVNGAVITIAGQGARTITWDATDVAGNTGSRSAVVNVDAGPPTKPALARPSSVTASTKPTFQWSASADSGSGIRSYVLTIQRSDGTVVAFQTVDANTTSVQSAPTLADGQTYTAIVTAVDNTVEPWTTASDPLTFRIDSSPDVSSPQDNAVLAFGAKKAPVAVTFDRPVDPNTKNGVTLTRDSAAGTSIPVSGPACSSPCTSISFTPTDSNGLPEGRYTLGVNVRSDEGVVIQKAFKFAVPDSANEDAAGGSNTNCALGSRSFAVSTTTGSETVLVGFDYSLASGSGQVKVLEGLTTERASRTLGPGTSSGQTLSFTLTPSGPHTLTFQFCGSGSPLSVSNVWASRAP